METKPKCKLTGTDGNIFALVGKACKVLKRVGQSSQAKEMAKKVSHADSYYEALGIIGEYVEIS